MSSRRLRSRADLTSSSAFSKAATSASSTSRPRRGAAAAASSTSSATIQRSPDQRRLSMQLTVKAPPEKLREATSRSSRNVAVNSRDTFQGGEIIAGPRSSRSKKVVVESSTESEEEEEEEEIEVDEDDAEGEEDEDQDMDDEEDDDAEGEEDEDMEDAPASPPIPVNPYHRTGRSAPKPSVKVTPADVVETKELPMADDASDDDLSDLSEEDEDEELGEDDAEGEEIDDEDGEGDDDSDETPASISRSNTPDLSKLTRRQRAAFEEHDGSLMALSNEAQKKKHLTAEEHASRRAEMARRRKNLSEKRNEEEKMDTINRLLKKQVPKRRGRAAAATLDAVAESGAEEEQEYEKPPAAYARYVQNCNGSSLAIPDEWITSPAGGLLSGIVTKPKKHEGEPISWSGKMVEEVA